MWEGVSCIVNIYCFGCWAFNSFWWRILSFNTATPASLSALYIQGSSSSPSAPAAQHITSGYSNQSLLFSSLQLPFQRWTMRHLPGGLHSYARHLNSLPHITLILVCSEGYRRENSLPVALDMLSLQETCSGLTWPELVWAVIIKIWFSLCNWWTLSKCKHFPGSTRQRGFCYLWKPCSFPPTMIHSSSKNTRRMKEK